ncbi:putative uncharacterized protein [Helicobacter pylori]|nr:putative uncharacterized protein [Helicobacter pylori]
MQSWNYKHANRNFKPKVWTNSVLLERGILEILEALKIIENRSRSQVLERLIIFFIETQKGQSNEKAWKRSQRAYKRTLINQTKKISLRESNLKELQRLKRKNNYKLTQIIRLAFLKGLNQFKKENLLVHLTLKEFDSFLEVLGEKNQKKR